MPVRPLSSSTSSGAPRPSSNRTRASVSVYRVASRCSSSAPTRAVWNRLNARRRSTCCRVTAAISLTPSKNSGRSRLDQAAADRVAGQLDAVAHPELVEDVLPVPLDRLHADHELLRDLLRRVGLRDQLQHLELARREHVEPLTFGSPAVDEVLHERRDGGRVEERLPAHRLPDGLDDVLVGVRLEDVAGRAGPERLEQELLAVVHREHQQLELRLALAQLLGRLDAGRLRHRDVEDRDVDVLAHRLLHRLGAVLGFGDDLEVGLRVEHAPQARADDRVVVGDEDARHERDRHQSPPAGTSRRTSTPPFPPGLIASAPPTSSARSRMPRIPEWPFRDAASSANPRPSSATRSTTLSTPGSSVTSTCFAPA